MGIFHGPRKLAEYDADGALITDSQATAGLQQAAG